MITVEKDGLILELRKDTYYYGGGTALSLIVNGFPKDQADDYFVGEPYCDVTVNLDGLQPDEFALDHNFTDWTDPDLIAKILDLLTENPLPHRYIPSGFVSFPVYTFKKEILDWDPEREVQTNE